MILLMFKSENILINNVIIFPLLNQYYIFNVNKNYIDSININRVMGILVEYYFPTK